LTHPEELLRSALVAAVGATVAPDGAVLISARPPNKQAATGTVIILLTRDDHKILDTRIGTPSWWFGCPSGLSQVVTVSPERLMAVELVPR
jgi:hypothetical protein